MLFFPVLLLKTSHGCQVTGNSSGHLRSLFLCHSRLLPLSFFKICVPNHTGVHGYSFLLFLVLRVKQAHLKLNDLYTYLGRCHE